MEPVARQQRGKLLDVMDQNVPEATGQPVLFSCCSRDRVGHQDLAHGSSPLPVVSASGFPPVPFNLDASV